MISPLRKYHFYTWRILAIALPLLFVAAILLRPDSPEKYSLADSDFLFSVKKQGTSSSQLTVELKNQLKAPSCQVYILSGTKDVLVGMIDKKGTYHFEFNGGEEMIRVRLYDAIGNKNIIETHVSYNSD